MLLCSVGVLYSVILVFFIVVIHVFFFLTLTEARYIFIFFKKPNQPTKKFIIVIKYDCSFNFPYFAIFVYLFILLRFILVCILFLSLAKAAIRYTL